MNIGAPTTGRARRSLKILGRATLSPKERNGGSLSGEEISRNLGFLVASPYSAPLAHVAASESRFFDLFHLNAAGEAGGVEESSLENP
jgi:hypothetical protein